LLKVHPAANVHDSNLNDHEFDSFEELSDQVLRADIHMTTPCEYHHEVFILRREIKIGRNWGEAAMKGVKWEAEVDPPEALEGELQAAWEAGGEQEAA